MAPVMTLASSAIGLKRSPRRWGIRKMMAAPASGVRMSAARIGKLGDAAASRSAELGAALTSSSS